MLRRCLPIVFALLGTVPLAAQDTAPADPSPPVQRGPSRDAASPPRPQDASRDTSAPPAGRSAQRRAESSGQAAEPPAAAPASGDQRRRPAGRDRDGGEPRVAVPREPGPAPRPGGRPDADGRPDPRPGDGPRVYGPGPRARGYYDPRQVYPYGYGLGLGYYSYDPYLWDPGAQLQFYGPGSYGTGYYGRGYTYDIGEIRLRVRPRDAQVFVDGYYAGVVDDYDGALQALRLESGPYHIKMVAPGYEPLEVDIRVSPGQRVTYRGELRRQP